MKRLTDLLFNRRKQLRTSPKKHRRRLLLEKLDGCALLASDFAAISGVVFFDTDNSGAFNTGDQVFQGIEVQLTNQAGTVNLTDTTDVNGLYRFDDLAAGTYTVTQLPPSPAGFQPAPNETPKSITITVGEADTLQPPDTIGIVIDTFESTELAVTADVGGTDPNSRSDVDASVGFGTTRDMFIDIITDLGAVGGDATLTSDLSNTGRLNYNPNGVTADFIVTYDGDNDPNVVSHTLDVDLTNGGAATALQLQTDSDRPDVVTDTITVVVFSGAGNSSSFTRPLVNRAQVGVIPEILIPFDAAPTSTTGTGADFTSVSAIQLVVTSPSGEVDTDIDLFRTIGPTVVTANFENEQLVPEINVEKATNGVDADTAPGPTLAEGSTATFTYVVTNPGDTALGSVVLTDDNGTPADLTDDFNPTLVSGDTNNNNILETTETWTYTFANHTVTTGLYTNISSVTANPVDAAGADIVGLADVTDTDPSNHTGVAAAIQIEKATNGQDADTATGPLLAVGSTATFTYVVTNTGGTPLGSVVVTDNRGVTVTRTSGDTNNNNILETTETWTFTGTTTVTAGQYTNIGSVTANPVDAAGVDIAGVADVTDTDPSNHFGVAAAINIEKSTNGQDADTGPGPLLPVGGTATFTYVVTNTGNTALGTVVVTDNRGVTVTRTGGDTNNNNILETTETWTYTGTATVASGQYTNIGTVTANPVSAAGADIAGVADVTDTDPSNHFGASPGINIEKSTNGADADTGTGPRLGVGGTATFTYVVTNTGNTSLGNVVVTDNRNVTPVRQSGDTNNNNLLDVGETWTYTASTTVVAGQYTNIGTATGNPVSTTGTDIAGVNDVTDTDPSNHFGVTPSIQIEKATNGVDADTTTGQPQVFAGSTVRFTYVVTNTGDTPLGSVVVTDDRGVTPVLQSGDTNNNNILETTETWTYEATTVATRGQYTNIGTVNANPVDATGTDIAGIPNVTDTDPSNHFGVDLSKRRFLASFINR
ncbi:MAG: SdrD B-like domain-containing protein [Pirellulaceae bacterium]